MSCLVTSWSSMAMICPQHTITQLPLSSPMLDLVKGFEKSCKSHLLFLPSLLLCQHIHRTLKSLSKSLSFCRYHVDQTLDVGVLSLIILNYLDSMKNRLRDSALLHNAWLRTVQTCLKSTHS